MARLPFMMLLWLECGTAGTGGYATAPDDYFDSNGFMTSIYRVGWREIAAIGIMPVHKSAHGWSYYRNGTVPENLLRYPWAMPRQLAFGVKNRRRQITSA